MGRWAAIAVSHLCLQGQVRGSVSPKAARMEEMFGCSAILSGNSVDLAQVDCR